METKYIKLDYEESLNKKKQILQTQVDILHLLISVSSYKELRRRKFKLKNELKYSINHIKTKINHVQITFPEEEKIRIKNKLKEHQNKENNINKRIMPLKENKHQSNFEKELQEIQRKLSKLS